MPFVRLENLSHKNCSIQGMRFVKSITRRPKVANIWIAGNFIVEAKLHTYPYARLRRWDKKSHQQCCWGQCSATHVIIFVDNEKLFHITKAGNKEFQNPWLLNHIMQRVFEERK